MQKVPDKREQIRSVSIFFSIQIKRIYVYKLIMKLPGLKYYENACTGKFLTSNATCFFLKLVIFAAIHFERYQINKNQTHNHLRIFSTYLSRVLFKLNNIFQTQQIFIYLNSRLVKSLKKVLSKS